MCMKSYSVHAFLLECVNRTVLESSYLHFKFTVLNNEHRTSQAHRVFLL